MAAKKIRVPKPKVPQVVKRAVSKQKRTTKRKQQWLGIDTQLAEMRRWSHV